MEGAYAVREFCLSFLQWNISSDAEKMLDIMESRKDDFLHLLHILKCFGRLTIQLQKGRQLVLDTLVELENMQVRSISMMLLVIQCYLYHF